MEHVNKPEQLPFRKTLYVIDAERSECIGRVEADDDESAEKKATEMADRYAKETGRCFLVAKPLAYF